MTPADNIYYFDGEIDVRLCLKNAYTTLKKAYVTLKPIDKFKIVDTNRNLDVLVPNHRYAGGQARYFLAMQFQDIWNIPFRKNSYRIAVKRDPVERFISAISYLRRERDKVTTDIFDKSYIKYQSYIDQPVNNILDMLESGELKDEHFFTQTYFMGHPDDYDKIYNISEVPALLELLYEHSLNPNVENISHLWYNKTKGSSSRLELTSDQQDRIMKLYERDYKRGWFI